MKKKPKKKVAQTRPQKPLDLKVNWDIMKAAESTPFRQFLDEDNKKKEQVVDGRTSQEKQIALLMDQLAEAKTGTATALDQVRLEESQKAITALTEANTRLMNIVELLAKGIAK